MLEYYVKSANFVSYPLQPIATRCWCSHADFRECCYQYDTDSPPGRSGDCHLIFSSLRWDSSGGINQGLISRAWTVIRTRHLIRWSRLMRRADDLNPTARQYASIRWTVTGQIVGGCHGYASKGEKHRS
jgi:hypothetical protein